MLLDDATLVEAIVAKLMFEASRRGDLAKAFPDQRATYLGRVWQELKRLASAGVVLQATLRISSRANRETR
jgi:hypothetical protein